MKSTLLVRSRLVARHCVAFLAASAILVTAGVVSSVPAGADRVVNGCTIVDNASSTLYTMCSYANLADSRLNATVWYDTTCPNGEKTRPTGTLTAC